MAVLEGKEPCKDHEPACCSKWWICAGIYLASRSTQHRTYRGWGNTSSNARFLHGLSQARGEVYLEEHKRFPVFLPINKLQVDSWVCFLESKGCFLSQQTPHHALPFSRPATSKASAGNFGCWQPSQVCKRKGSVWDEVPERCFTVRCSFQGRWTTKGALQGIGLQYSRKNPQNLCQLKPVAMFISLTNPWKVYKVQYHRRGLHRFTLGRGPSLWPL